MPALLMLGATALVWRVGLWSPGLPLFGHLIFFAHPLIRRATDELISGRLPLWNPYAFCGRPLLADPGAQVMAPTHVVFRLFAFETAFKLELASVVALTAFFSYCLGRRLGLRRSAAGLAGFLAASNGFLYYHTGMLSHLDAICLAPAVLLFWHSGSGLLMGLALALQYLGGHPFFVYMTLAVCPFLPPGRPIRTLASASAAGLTLAAAQLLPALELFGSSVRSGALSPASVYVYSLTPDELWRMLSRPWWNLSAANFSGDPSITSFYVGLPALAAVLWGLGGGRAGRALGTAALASLWLMMGDHTPFYPLLLKLLPGLALFRFPAQWGAMAALLLAILAGLGAARLNRALRGLLVAAVFVDLWGFTAEPPTPRASCEFYCLRPAPLASGELGREPCIAHTRAFFEGRAKSQFPDVPLEQTEGYWLSLKNALTPSHASAFGVREVVSNNIDRPRRADELLRPVLSVEGAGSPLLRLLGVSALIDGDSSGRSRILRLSSPRPRVSWVARARFLPYPDSLSYLASRRFSPEDEVVLEGRARRQGGAAAGEARVVEEAPTRLSARTHASTSGFLVWADSFDAGWKATLDGVPVDILRADGAYRAVAVPAGEHDIRFRYRPLPFELGLWVTLSSLAFLAALGLWILRPALELHRREVSAILK